MNYLEQIYALIDFAFQNPNNELRRIDIGVIENSLAEKSKKFQV